MPPYALETESLWDAGTIDINDLLTVKEVPEGLSTEKKVPEFLLSPEKRSVSFSESVAFREIAPLDEISKEEIRSVWYNDDEYARLKKEVTATIKILMNAGSIEEDEGYCLRGLEGRTKFGARRRKNNKAGALDAVWNAQLLLWKKKEDNPAAIAVAYKPHSLHAKYPALERGQSDQMFVKQSVRSGDSLLS
jgi:hypothetical protein